MVYTIYIWIFSKGEFLYKTRRKKFKMRKRCGRLILSGKEKYNAKSVNSFSLFNEFVQISR